LCTCKWHAKLEPDQRVSLSWVLLLVIVFSLAPFAPAESLLSLRARSYFTFHIHVKHDAVVAVVMMMMMMVVMVMDLAHVSLSI
jgi:hypothetical protein